MITTILDYFFIGVTELGSELFYLILLPPIFWALNKKFGFRLFFLSLLAGYVAAVLKNLIGSPRPPESGHKTYSDASGFPSGHATGATAFWGYLIVTLKDRYILVVGTALTVLVSISRVYLGVHYPVDIIGGVVIGIGLVIGFLVFEPRVSSKLNTYNVFQKLAIGFTATGIFAVIAFFTIPEDMEDLRTIYGAGALMGITIGYILECETTNFTVEITTNQKILRVIIGYFVAFSIYFSLLAVMPPVSMLWQFIIAFLGAFNVTFIAPVVFTSFEKYS